MPYKYLDKASRVPGNRTPCHWEAVVVALSLRTTNAKSTQVVRRGHPRCLEIIYQIEQLTSIVMVCRDYSTPCIRQITAVVFCVIDMLAGLLDSHSLSCANQYALQSRLFSFHQPKPKPCRQVYANCYREAVCTIYIK